MIHWITFRTKLARRTFVCFADDCPPNPPAAKKRTRKRRFLTSEPTDTSAVMKTKVEEMDEAIQKKCKGKCLVPYMKFFMLST